MPTAIKHHTRCIICGSTDIMPYLSLGNMALANSFATKQHLTKPAKKYPLGMTYCHACHLSQLTHTVNPKNLFQTYAYFSSTSPQLVAHFSAYAKDLWRLFPTLARGLVVDVGSNDGILLVPLKKRGSRVLGVDPAKNVAAAAAQAGIHTMTKFFTPTLAQIIINKYGQANIISANNVFAHTPDIHLFMTAVKRLLCPGGIFVFEVKYLGDLIGKNEFDTIYHEHVFSYILHPLVTLLGKYAMQIFDVHHVDTHGGSLRIFASHIPLPFAISPSVSTYLQKEIRAGYTDLTTYTRYAQKPPAVKKKLLALLTSLKQKNKRIAAYGASAKGSTLLQYCGIDTNFIDFVVDTTPYKIGKYMPGTHIPIVDARQWKKHPPDYILLLAWNFSDSIIKREAWFGRRGGKFILPIPAVGVV